MLGRTLFIRRPQRAIAHRAFSTSRTLCSATTPVFFDMVHSNNAARIRLWLRKKGGDAEKDIQTRMVKYDDLQSEEFVAVNPLKKVPALIRADGTCVAESDVILRYLEDKYSGSGPSFTPSTPEGRQAMNSFIRMHDLYVASPNCTAPGFSHSQGAMYLSTEWHGPARGMDVYARAAKIEELYKRLCWMEENIDGPEGLVENKLSLADFTVFPTLIFMEHMLPRVFGWEDFLNSNNCGSFPRLREWFLARLQDESFVRTRSEIWEYWVDMDGKGQFEPIKREIGDEKSLKWKYP